MLHDDSYSVTNFLRTAYSAFFQSLVYRAASAIDGENQSIFDIYSGLVRDGLGSYGARECIRRAADGNSYDYHVYLSEEDHERAVNDIVNYLEDYGVAKAERFLRGYEAARERRAAEAQAQ